MSGLKGGVGRLHVLTAHGKFILKPNSFSFQWDVFDFCAHLFSGACRMKAELCACQALLMQCRKAATLKTKLQLRRPWFISINLFTLWLRPCVSLICRGGRVGVALQLVLRGNLPLSAEVCSDHTFIYTRKSKIVKLSTCRQWILVNETLIHFKLKLH